MVVNVIWLCVAVATLPMPAQMKEMTAADESAVRRALTAIEFMQSDRDALAKLGGYSPVAFPLYARILDDPKERPLLATRTLFVLSEIKADRSQFLERAVALLAHPRPGVRHTAVELLAQIGGERDAAPIVALLADEDVGVGIAAANTLATIGGPRELAALNVWLAVSKPENYSKEWQGRYEALRKNVTKSRDALKARLDKAKAQTPKP